MPVEIAQELFFFLNRGAGLFVGVELVTDREKKTPATETAALLINRYSIGVLYSRY